MHAMKYLLSGLFILIPFVSFANDLVDEILAQMHNRPTFIKIFDYSSGKQPTLEQIKSAIESGADINAIDKAGKTAFDYAKENKHLINTDAYQHLKDAQSK